MRTLPAALALCAALAACTSDAPRTGASGSPSDTPSTSATTPPAASPTPTPTPSATALPTDLKDGRTYFRLTALDLSRHTITIDVVQFLTGEAARRAAEEEGEEAYDYYVENENPRLRTLTLSAKATVVVNTLRAEETGSSTKNTTITQAKLKGYVDSGKAKHALFYLTLSKGVVVAVNEQYLS